MILHKLLVGIIKTSFAHPGYKTLERVGKKYYYIYEENKNVS